MLILSFIIFLGSILAMLWMIIRLFPELAEISIVRHKHFSFFGIHEIHILEYKDPTLVAKKNIFIFFEKTLRRVRSWILKLDNNISKKIAAIQQKNQELSAPSEARKIEDIIEQK